MHDVGECIKTWMQQDPRARAIRRFTRETERFTNHIIIAGFSYTVNPPGRKELLNYRVDFVPRRSTYARGELRATCTARAVGRKYLALETIIT